MKIRIGIVACHVDDFMHCGLNSFSALVMDKVIVRFSAGKREAKAFKYIGFDVKQDDYSISFDMKGYLRGHSPFKIIKYIFFNNISKYMQSYVKFIVESISGICF